MGSEMVVEGGAEEGRGERVRGERGIKYLGREVRENSEVGGYQREEEEEEREGRGNK